MRTRIDLNADLVKKAAAIREALNDEPGPAIQCMLRRARQMYKQLDHHLTVDVRLDHIESYLNYTVCWLVGAVEVCAAHRATLAQHFDAKGGKLDREQRTFVHQSSALLNFMAQVVTELRREIAVTSANEAMAEYAHFLAVQALRITGPVQTNVAMEANFIHPDAGHWHHILAKTRRVLANLWSESAKAAEAIGRKYEKKTL